MAKIKTNLKKDSPMVEKSPETKPRYSVEEIENGYIVEKSWTNKDGRYCCTKTYYEENPLEEMEESEKED